jgi:hypothetical protein
MFIKNSFILMSLLLLAGCATSGSVSDDGIKAPKALNVSTALKFVDVPVPSGFKMIVSQSFTFENDVLRVGILKYKGRASGDRVANFYKDQMPLYNWRFTNMLEYGRKILNFEREDQNCIIVIEPDGMSTFVTITVAPKSGRATTYKSVRRDD